jgi:hypothetical protein
LGTEIYDLHDFQVEMIMGSAMKAGFSGGLVVDYPNSTKAKKYFLCLFAGSSGGTGAQQQQTLPKGLEDGEEVEKGAVAYAGKRYERCRDLFLARNEVKLCFFLGFGNHEENRAKKLKAKIGFCTRRSLIG